MNSEVAIALLAYLFIVVLLAIAGFLISLFVSPKRNKPTFIQKLRKRNELYLCYRSDCARLYRHYQWQLYETVKGVKHCPHCERIVITERNGQVPSTKPEVYDPWMDTHVDCFRVGLFQYLSVLRLTRSVKKKQLEQESIDRFLEYNEKESSTSWVEHLSSKE